VVRRRFGEPTNTTIGVVATNARLTREEAQKIAQMSHNGLARCIRPVHTLFDGDAVFVLAQGQVTADLHLIGVLAETAIQEAIISAVKSAHGLGVLPCYEDLKKL
jgi:L-aminopeptidase/D-esterase-like protein